MQSVQASCWALTLLIVTTRDGVWHSSTVGTVARQRPNIYITCHIGIHWQPWSRFSDTGILPGGHFLPPRVSLRTELACRECSHCVRRKGSTSGSCHEDLPSLLFFFETGSHCIVLACLELTRDLPASISRVLGLKVCSTPVQDFIFINMVLNIGHRLKSGK